MAHDRIVYLNREPAFMRAGLVSGLEALPAKMQKAPGSQWRAAIKSIVGKGQAKQAEIDDCDVEAFLQGANGIDRPGVLRSELIDYVKNRQVTVKEVTLGEPKYRSWSHAAHVPQSAYAEVLFIANSERMNLQDRVEEIDWELEQFNFDIDKLSQDPSAVLRLEDERRQLLVNIPKAWDYTAPHFTQEGGKYAKNLIAHGRELVYGDTYLIEEVQSDWGQRGRKNKWAQVPKGPFVTDTKLWAGLVVRRMLQRAAMNPQVKKVAWIRGSMRNGGLQVTEDNLDEFYLQVVRGIADKAIAKAGGKTQLRNLQLGSHLLADVPMFEMTDAVREHLQGTQPLYSLTRLQARAHEFDDEQRLAFHARARHIIGSSRHVLLVDRVYDIATGRQVPGRYLNRVVQVSLHAGDPEYVLDHECVHYAVDQNLLYAHETEILMREFQPGSELNRRTAATLERLGEHMAARQCAASWEEAAAHGFALWARDKLDVSDKPVQGIFADLRVLVSDTVAWFKRTVLQYQCTNVQEVFGALLNGERAEPERRGARWREPA
jgi:hypothetical protein